MADEQISNGKYKYKRDIISDIICEIQTMDKWIFSSLILPARTDRYLEMVASVRYHHDETRNKPVAPELARHENLIRTIWPITTAVWRVISWRVTVDHFRRRQCWPSSMMDDGPTFAPPNDSQFRRQIPIPMPDSNLRQSPTDSDFSYFCSFAGVRRSR